MVINGPFQAGLYQVFSCAGKGAAVFGQNAVKEVYPEWWGASGVYGASNNDTPYIQAAVNSLPYGGIIQLCGTGYRLDQIDITTSGISLLGCGSKTVIYKEIKSIGNSAISIDLSAARFPFYFRFADFQINSGSAGLAAGYDGISLRFVRQGGGERIRFSGINNCLVGDSTYWTSYKDFEFDDYNVGITGISSNGFNNNVYINMNFFVGNQAGTAVPINTLYMNNCQFIGGSVGASDTQKIANLLLQGWKNVIWGMRFEADNGPLSATDWILMNGVQEELRDCVVVWSGSSSPKAGYYAVKIAGNENKANLSLQGAGNLVYLAPGTVGNEVWLENTQASGENIVSDFGDNLIHYGKSDHMRGGNSWSDVPVTNLFTRSIDFNNVTPDGLSMALQTGSAGRGPLNCGNVYCFTRSASPYYWSQDTGPISQYETRVFSIWVKAVNSGSGHTETISIGLNASWPDQRSRTIRDDIWTRISCAYQPTSQGYSHCYAGITLGSSSNGVYLWGPQVISLGVTSINVMAGYMLGGYVPTYAAARTDRQPRDAWQWQANTPAYGVWRTGDVCKSLAPARSAPPRWVCTSGGADNSATWVADNNLLASP